MSGANLREIINELIEQKLLLTHTAFLGRVTAVNGGRASVQPLTYAKQASGAVGPQPLVVDAPVLRGIAVQEGDVALCCVCERDITMALRGQMGLPEKRRHSLADSIVIGVVQDDARV